MIQYAKQSISQSDIDAVVAVLKSDMLTQGPVTLAFEESITNYCKAKSAIVVNSATSALHIACLALELKPGDLVWTTPITFVASANCALYCGAEVDFVDIDEKSYNISVEKLKDKLILSKKNNRIPKILIPVHLSGQPCEMAEIFKLAQIYGFKIIEDASHAIGAKYRSPLAEDDSIFEKNDKNFYPIGNCEYSDITIFSFHPVKIITSGEGGAAVTNNMQLAKRMRLFRSHGITNLDEDIEPQNELEIWNYQQIALGFNYRMTEIQASLGINQLKRIDEFLLKRHMLANRYNEQLKSLPIKLPWQNKNIYSSFHLYIIRLNSKEIVLTQKQVYEKLRSKGVLVNLHYIPVYRHPYYERIGFKKGYCSEAELYFSEALSIPLYPDLSIKQQDIVIEELNKILNI